MRRALVRRAAAGEVENRAGAEGEIVRSEERGQGGNFLGLADAGVTDLHFYTMNRADLVYSICRLLDVHPVAQADTTHQAVPA